MVRLFLTTFQRHDITKCIVVLVITTGWRSNANMNTEVFRQAGLEVHADGSTVLFELAAVPLVYSKQTITTCRFNVESVNITYLYNRNLFNPRTLVQCLTALDNKTQILVISGLFKLKKWPFEICICIYICRHWSKML